MQNKRSYLGSKGGSGTYQMIINNMPPHRVFIDAFVGSGVITLKKKPAEITYINDLDDKQVTKVYHRADEQDLGCVRQRSFDALELFDLVQALDGKFERDTFIYCDPPYLHSTRTSNSRYKHEFSKQDHVDLITYLRKLKANVMISGYPSQLYDAMLANWRFVEFQSMTRGGVRTEKIWMNYKLDSIFQMNFAGKNFTDRQRIKRKVQRWQDKYAGLPVIEQQAIMQALMEVHRV